jgi:cysteine desulfurase/selenocysteine lyase
MNEKTKKYKIVYAKDKNNFPSEQAFISSITKKTRIISLSTTNSLFGVSINIKNIVAVARKINKNIIIVVDATQTAPSQGFDFKNTDVDLFVCSSHKMLGPNGVGILGGKFSILNKFTSIKIGGGSVSTVENDKINFSPIPERLEPGTPNVEGIIGFNSAINFIKKIGIKNIIKHEKELKKYIDQKIIKIKNIDYPSYGTDFPICSFNIKGVSPQDLANYLGNKKIIVRGGMSCVKMISKFASPSGYVRASFYLYNTKKDIDKLIYELKKYKPGNELKNIV